MLTRIIDSITALRHALLLAASLYVLYLPGSARADAISFDLSETTLSVASGGNVIFTGTVTNNSTVDLNASDFFFNFFGYDPTSVTPNQDLGVASDFLIPNGMSSPTVALFDVTLGKVSPGASFPILVQLEDVNNDLSATQTVTVSEAGTPVPEPVPEPPMLWPLAAVLLVLFKRRLWKSATWVPGSGTRWAGALMIGVLILFASRAFGQSVPVFSTQTPVSGLNGDTFVVFLPLTNSGTAPALNVQITAVTLSGTISGTSLTSPHLPFGVPGALRPANYYALDLQFAADNLMVGSQRLLTVRGTYEIGGQVSGFTVNRFVTVTVPSSSLLTEIQQWMDLDAVVAKINTLPGLDVAADNQALLAFIQSIPDFVQSGIDPPSSSVWAAFADGTPVVFANDREPPSSATSSSQAATYTQTTTQPTAHLQPLSADRQGLVASANSGAVDAVDIDTEIPASSQIRLLWADGFQLTGDAILNDLVPWLKAANYKPSVQIDSLTLSDQNASVENLKNPPSGEGMLYFASHGSFFGDGSPAYPWVYVVATSTQSDIVADFQYPDDLRKTPRTLIRVGVKTDRGEVMRYGITATFVSKYWKDFSNNSFVYISACGSDDPRPSTIDPPPIGVDIVAQSAQDFKQAVFEKNVSVYAGWTSDVHEPIAVATDLLLFDRLLGANQWDPPNFYPLSYPGFENGQFLKETIADANGNTFYQRPFDWESVIQSDVQMHSIQTAIENSSAEVPLGIDNYVTPPAKLQIDANPSMSQAVFGLLAPSIELVQIWESGLTSRVLGQPQLQIFGNFGSQQGTVTVGGQNADVQFWFPGEIIANFPSSGVSGSDVVVSFQDHASNVARLTEWTGQFTFKGTWNGDGQTSAGSLTETVTLNPDWRVDFRESRPKIHLAPVFSPLAQGIQNIVNSTSGSFMCTGSASYTVPIPSPPFVIDYDYLWHGGGSLTSWNSTVPASPPSQPFALAGALGLPLGNPMFLEFDFSGGPQACTAEISPGSPVSFDIENLLADGQGTNVALSVDAGTAVISGGNIPLGCLAPAPLSATTNCSLTWNTIYPIAGSVPDPKSAR